MFDEVRKAKKLIYHLLSYRWHTQMEIEDKLFQNGYSKEIVKEVINDLKKNKYLDDQRFAENWIENRAQRKLLGRKRIRQELKNKGIDDTVISENLKRFFDNNNELELALEAARKKSTLSTTLEKEKFVRRISSFLQRRGFSYDVIKRVINLLEEEGRDK